MGEGKLRPAEHKLYNSIYQIFLNFTSVLFIPSSLTCLKYHWSREIWKIHFTLIQTDGHERSCCYRRLSPSPKPIPQKLSPNKPVQSSSVAVARSTLDRCIQPCAANNRNRSENTKTCKDQRSSKSFRGRLPAASDSRIVASDPDGCIG